MGSQRGQREAAKLDVREDHRLKLGVHGLRRKKLRRSEMAAAGIVDHDVEVSGFTERGVETLA